MHARPSAVPAPEEDDLFEIANLYPRTTGLPVTVWVSPRGGARHDARVKVNTQPGDRIDLSQTAVVGIRPKPALIEGELASEHFAAVARWIEANREPLLRYWDGEVDTAELLSALRKI